MAARAETRVVVGDDGYDPEQVRSLLGGTGVTVAEQRRGRRRRFAQGAGERPPGGAALDVLPVEPPTAEHPAPVWPRLVVTPHVAWYSAEADEACHTRPVLSVRAVLEGRVPDGAVNSP